MPYFLDPLKRPHPYLASKIIFNVLSIGDLNSGLPSVGRDPDVFSVPFFTLGGLAEKYPYAHGQRAGVYFPRHIFQVFGTKDNVVVADHKVPVRAYIRQEWSP